MTLDGAPKRETIDTTELHQRNLERLSSLMGDAYNGMEMQDYLSYLPPAQVSTELDMLEVKLVNGKGSEDLMRNFKAHLAYLAA